MSPIVPRRPVRCPHCSTVPHNLDMHLRFHCPTIRPTKDNT